MTEEPTTAEAFDLEAFLPYQLAVLSERVSRGFSAIYGARFGISRPEWRVLAHLSSAQRPLSVREVHARVSMDKSKVSRAATRLEELGLVEKRPNERDRRLVALSLTKKGAALVAEMAPIARAYEADVLAHLGEDAETFRTLVARLLETLE